MSSYYQCRGLTQRGTQCVRESGLIGGYCHQHQHQRNFVATRYVATQLNPAERLERIRQARLDRIRIEQQPQVARDTHIEEDEDEEEEKVKIADGVMEQYYKNQFKDLKNNTWRMERC